MKAILPAERRVRVSGTEHAYDALVIALGAETWPAAVPALAERFREFDGGPVAAVFAQGQAETAARGVARHLGCDAPEPWFPGEGWCCVEVGDGMAAGGRGNFLARPDPEVELLPPDAVHRQAKEVEEAAWWDHWRTPA